METFRDVIDAWPRQYMLAKDVGRTAANVSLWRTRDNIPPAYWLTVIEAARNRGIAGIDLPTLAAMAEKGRK